MVTFDSPFWAIWAKIFHRFTQDGYNQLFASKLVVKLPLGPAGRRGTMPELQ